MIHPFRIRLNTLRSKKTPRRPALFKRVTGKMPNALDAEDPDWLTPSDGEAVTHHLIPCMGRMLRLVQ